MKLAYNQLKLRALAAYSYLRRLWGWRLLERSLDRRGLLLYRLSERGQARLAWLRERAPARGRT